MIMKNIIDFFYNRIKDIEELLSIDSVVLNMKRSIQLDGYSCGAQVVYSILDYYGINKSLDEIIKSLKTTEKNGTNTERILDYLMKNGLDVKINDKGTFSFIKNTINKGYPMLITVDDGEHWVVIYGYSNKGVYVLDSLGSRLFNQWSRKEFFERWDEHWLVIIKGEPR